MRTVKSLKMMPDARNNPDLHPRCMLVCSKVKTAGPNRAARVNPRIMPCIKGCISLIAFGYLINEIIRVLKQLHILLSNTVVSTE